MKPVKKVIHEGSAYYSVLDAARLLGTSAPKVREMMGNGNLEWTQFRVNGKLFITAKSILEKQSPGI